MCTCCNTCEAREQLLGVGFLLHFVGSGSQTQVIRHWWKAFYPRSDLIGPTYPVILRQSPMLNLEFICSARWTSQQGPGI